VPAIRWVQSAVRLAALAAALLVGADEGDARPADGLTVDTGESASFIASPVLSTDPGGTVRLAPRMTAQVVPSYPGGTLSGLFNRGGMLGGFAAGFLGAGLLGLLFGRGLSAGLNGVPSYLGLIFQIALLVMLCRLIWTRWRSDDALSPAGLSPRQLADPYLRSRDDLYASIDPSAGDDDLGERRLAGEDASASAQPSRVAESRGSSD
jgi:predicted lipid-binding transport protein (Tim44 family)